MNQTSRKIAALAFGSLMLAQLPATAGTLTPKREFRSTWFTTHVNIDWPQVKGNSPSIIAAQKADLLKYLDGFEKMNLNGICFHVRAQCDACYKSSYEPWSAVMTGTRGTDPGWDPLAYAVEECHKRGLECYAWINPYRWTTGTIYSTPQDEEFKAKGWLLAYGSYQVLNPALPEVREHILKVCKEIVDNYAIDGVLFDDYFYPNYIPEDATAGDWADYKASGTTMSIGDWRRENINIFVREFQKMIEEAHPDMRFGISPAGVAGSANTSAGKYGVVPNPAPAGDWQYNTIYSDPLAWLNDGSIDFISPQIYWTTSHPTAPYEPLCEWWSYIAEHFGRHFYSSQSVALLADNNSAANWAEIATEVKLNRKYAQPTAENAPGSIYFSSKYFYGPTASGLGDHLLENVYPTRSLVPVVTWKNVPVFGAPANLTFDGTALAWTAIDAPKSIMRYTVYAVPRTTSYEEALESDGDGISNDYLLKVSYSSSFQLPEDKRQGYWYAVCAYDGLGNEFEPAIVNYAEGVSRKVDLLTPADGATAEWSQPFTWSEIDGADYQLRIAADADFKDIMFISDKTGQASVTVDMDALKPATDYYWNVLSMEPDKLRATSETRRFVTPSFTDAPAATPIAPADGAEIEGTATFSWTAAPGVSSYTLQIAADANFRNMRYTAKVAASTTSTSVNLSLVGKGTFHWRIVTEGRHFNPTASNALTFTVSNISVGSTEAGYTIRKDPAKYNSGVADVTIENLWMRSAKTGFSNISFSENGAMQRSMVAVGDYVYLSRRSENSQTAELWLDKYDGFTGERITSLRLGEEGNVPFYPINTVTKDNADNIVIANLSLNATTTPVVVHHVNTVDGSLKEVANIRLSGLASARVDHVAVSGDVAAGNFDVYMAMASGVNIARATYRNGVQTEVTTPQITTFYPTSCSTFGIAAAVTPVSHDEVLVNGGGLGLALYDLTLRRAVDSFASNTTLSSGATNGNGSCRFTMGDINYTVYPLDDYSSPSGIRFDIVRGTTPAFASMQRVATVPTNGLGTVNSGNSATPISAVCDNDGTARVYVYASGNGLACYRITDLAASVSAPVADNENIEVRVDGRNILFSRTVGRIEVYSPSGALVTAARGLDSVTVPAQGLYIVVADGNVSRQLVR